MENNKKTMWQMIKAGFAFALGGSIGWRLGNFIADLFGKAARMAMVGLTGFGFAVGMQHVPDYQPTEKAKVEQVRHVKHHAAAVSAPVAAKQ